MLLRQQAAVERALTEARDRYALGDIPITDTHEATARARQLQAQVLAAQHERDLARGLLSENTGLSPTQLALQAPAANQPPIPTESLEHWQNLARQQDHRVRQLKLQALLAEAETRKFQARDSASVDLVAQASGEHLAGTGDFGSASTAQWQRMVGISVTVPLWTGGWRQAKLQESVKLLERAGAEVERAQQSAGQSARTAWLGLHSGLARLDALRLALAASAARLDATQLGRQLGDRTTMDLLNAENDLAASELLLLQVRVELLMSRLRLAAAAGQLDEAQLQMVNASLQP
ncbi:MAG: transporter [Rhodoferax sp.]|nr:transporter [Rhodoferax sp.]